MKEEVAIYLIHVIRAWSGIRKPAHEHVRTVAIGARLVVFDKDVVTNDRGAGTGWHSRHARPGQLEFDFHVIADRVLYQIVLYDAGNERIRSIGVPQIQPRTRAHDGVMADDPIPSWDLGRDTIGLLPVILSD